MAPPSDSTIIELSATTITLIKVAATLFAALCGLISWLAVKMWKGARELAEKTQELDQIPKMQAQQKRLSEAIFGVVTDEEIVRPGALRRLSSAEGRVDTLYEVLDLDNANVKRAAIARSLGVTTITEVDHSFSGVRDRGSDTGRHRVFIMPPPPDADEGEG